MNFKTPVSSARGMATRATKIISLGYNTNTKDGIYKPTTVRFNNPIMIEYGKDLTVAFSIEKDRVVVVFNPTGIPTYVTTSHGAGKGVINVINNLDLGTSISEAFGLPNEKGTRHFDLVPITKWNGFDTYELKLRDK